MIKAPGNNGSVHRSQRCDQMKDFEQVLKQYEPMISSILKKANIYKNREHFRQSARIALWQAWQKYDPTRGHFAPYAYRTMLTTIYKEMHTDNRYTERQIAYESDKLTIVAEYMEVKHRPCDLSETFEHLKQMVTEDEYALLVDLYYHQYKYEELTDKYDASIAALKKRRDRLLKKIRATF